MNKHQKALDNLKNMGDKDLYNERHLEWTNTLQELVDKEQDYTLEEVKKEWEELGYICVCDSENELIFEEEQSIPFYDYYCNRVHILKKWKLYDVVTIIKQNNKRKEIRLLLNFEIHQLLTKTFKALGWM